MADLASIEQLQHRLAYATDQRDTVGVHACLRDDVSVEIVVAGEVAGRLDGRDEWTRFQRYFWGLSPDGPQERHLFSNGFLVEDGEDAATIMSYLTVTVVEEGTVAVRSTGWCRDRVVNEAGAWQLQDRHVELDADHLLPRFVGMQDRWHAVREAAS